MNIPAPLFSDGFFTKQWQDWLSLLARMFNNLNITVQSLLGSAAYTTTNVTVTRTFDADTVTLPELADVVGTLIEDLKAKDILS